VGPNTAQCNDGDSILFNGLLCLANVTAQTDGLAAREKAALREVGCDVVKQSQTTGMKEIDGRWWRSPRRKTLALQDKQPEGGSETTFSNDHALGVIAYIAKTKDSQAFQAWTNWMTDYAGICHSANCIPGLPRYCPDDRCGFKIVDCPLLDALANYLGRDNPLCASDSVKHAQALAWNVADFAFSRVFHLFVPQLDQILDKYGKGTRAAHSLERIILINSIVNGEGYSLNDVAATVYLLRTFGIVDQAESQLIAEIVYARGPSNAFFDLVANGSTAAVKDKIVSTCPPERNDIPHPKFQWIWERQNIAEAAKKSMYWDCIFIAHAFEQSAPPSADPPGKKEMQDLAVDVARIRKELDSTFIHLQTLFHPTRAYCSDIECSGRDIDCGKPHFLDKVSCEAQKSAAKSVCEAEKAFCLAISH
jgi:hypothetical protein